MVGALPGLLPGLARRYWCFSRRAWLHGQARAACFLVAQTCSVAGSCPRGARQGRLPLRPNAALSHRRHARHLHAAASVEDDAALDAYDERFMAMALEEARRVCARLRRRYHRELNRHPRAKQRRRLHPESRITSLSQAAAEGEVPVGAVLVADGKVVARARNCVELTGDPTAHAELLVIQQARRLRVCCSSLPWFCACYNGGEVACPDNAPPFFTWSQLLALFIPCSPIVPCWPPQYITCTCIALLLAHLCSYL